MMQRFALPAIVAALFGQVPDIDAPASAHWSGEIDAQFVSMLEARPAAVTWLRVSSGGGSANSGLVAAGLLANRGISIRIERYCISACAEFLIPGAAAVSLGPSAVIGFHGNDIAYSRIAETLGEAHSCSALRLPELLRFYQRRGLKPSFSNEVERRLGRRSPRVEPSDAGCGRVLSETEIAYWYPTSSQLQTLWGLPVAGPICADDPACVQSRIFPITEPDDRVVIGDSVLVAKPGGFERVGLFDAP